MPCCLRFEPKVWGWCLVLPTILTYWERHSPLCTFVSTPKKGQSDASCLTSLLWGSKEIRHMTVPCKIQCENHVGGHQRRTRHNLKLTLGCPKARSSSGGCFPGSPLPCNGCGEIKGSHLLCIYDTVFCRWDSNTIPPTKKEPEADNQIRCVDGLLGPWV